MNYSTDTRKRLSVAICCGLVVSTAYMVPTMATPSLLSVVMAVLLGLCATIGVSLWRSTARLSGLVIVSSILAALLVAMSVPLARDNYPDVSITATGDKNPKSHSSEVWVSLLSGPVQGEGNFKGNGWEKRGNTFVSYQKQPSVLHYRGAWSSGAALRIVRHPYSGIAEVSIGGKTQRLDLFSKEETYIDVPLPEGSVSWKGYLQRPAIVIGLSIFITAVGMGLAVTSATWAGVFMLALLAGCGSLWLVHDHSYTGSMEVVAFSANSKPVRVEMDAGHGFTPALVEPVKGGTSVETDFTVQNPTNWRLHVEGGSLHVFRDLDAGTAGETLSGSDNGCINVAKGRCIYEVVQGVKPLRVWMQAGAEQKALLLPASVAGSERLFLLVEREPGRITVSASRAYLQLSPWEHFSRWITSIRVVDQDGKAAGRLVRLLSDGVGGYRFAQAATVEGAYQVPAMVRPDTHAFLAMKVFAGLVSASIVLLIAAAGKIARTLTLSFRDGRRVQVVASVFGCLGWLGLGVLAGWPAIMGWDGFSPYIQAQTGSITLWYGLGYPMIVGGFLLLGSGPLVTAWSVLGTAVLLLGAAALLLRHSSTTASWLAPVLLCVALPFTAVILGMMTHLRDAMNGLMLAMFAFCGFYAALKWQTWSGVQRIWILVGLMLGGAMLALLRIDNIPTLLFLAGGLVLGTCGFGVRPFALIAVTAVCWIGVSPQVERFAVPDPKGAAYEKRLYDSTALINPLTGILVYGKGRIPDALYVDIYNTLDKVMDADVASQRWSPYQIVYWHETNTERDPPSIETIDHLRRLYLSAFKADPVLFIKLRLATFGAILGHEWFESERHPKVNISFDHLLTVNPNWRHLSELLGYAPKAHPVPELTQDLLDWSNNIASTVPQLVICILVMFRFRRSPLTAVVATGEIMRAGVFFLFAPASVFLYLYDMHLLGYLLPMMALTEQAVRLSNRTREDTR